MFLYQRHGIQQYQSRNKTPFGAVHFLLEFARHSSGRLCPRHLLAQPKRSIHSKCLQNSFTQRVSSLQPRLDFLNKLKCDVFSVLTCSKDFGASGLRRLKKLLLSGCRVVLCRLYRFNPNLCEPMLKNPSVLGDSAGQGT